MAPTAMVDSVVLIAALHARDAHHSQAREILEAADRGEILPMILTDFLFAETLNYLTIKGGSAVGREALKRVEASHGLRIERTPDPVFAAGKNEVYAKINGLSLVDALTVFYLRERGGSHLYSFDDVFDRVSGIQRLVTPAQ